MRSRKIAPKADGSTPPVSPSPTPPSQPRRRKAGETKAWLVVSESGKSRLEEVGKRSIMRRTGVGAHDLRILDPMLSHPSTVLGRQRAIVINLEHIKAIVTATEVLVLSSKDPQFTVFAEDLQCHLSNQYYSSLRKAAAESSDIDTETREEGPWVSASIFLPDDDDDQSEWPSPTFRREISVEMRGQSTVASAWGAPNRRAGTDVLPFEFRVLEVCLNCACKWLESEASPLEKEAYPALEELTSKISSLNLERVRQIKSRLVSTSCRIQKVRDELEHLLDNDMLMAEMYLTDKLLLQRSEEASSVPADSDDDAGDNALDVEDERYEDTESKAKSINGSPGVSKPNVGELEMLLEAYFTRIEGTLTKLSTLQEYVHDSEGYINLMLDDKQNRMLQTGVMVTTATFVLSLGFIVVESFSLTIHNPLFDDTTQTQFLEATFGITGGCVILYIIAVALLKKMGLFA